MPAVFISYSRRDKAFVQRLHDSLSARDYDVWVDWEDIPPSAEWFAEIQAGVREADGFIYVISPDSVSSAVCTRELANALAQHKRVVPVVCREPDGVTVPEAAAALNWVFLRVNDDFDAGLDLLTTALETDLDHVRMHTRLGVQAAQWESGGRDHSQLLRGSELGSAEAWLVAGAGLEPQATQLQREYLLAGRQAATRRQRTVISGVSFALVVAVVLAVVALVQRSTAIHERNVAFSRQLDADAQNAYSTDPELSLLLAVRAAQVQPSGQSESTLRTALAESNVRARWRLTGGEGGDVIWSPDRRRLLVTSPGSGSSAWARIYTPGSNAPPVSLPGPSARQDSGWDSAGDRVVVGGEPAVYDARTGHLIRRLPGSAIHAALSPDGRRVVTVDINAVGHVYDVATGRSLATFRPHYRGGTDCFALSPDGRYVAQCDALSFRLVGNVPAELDLWSTRSGRLVRSIRVPALISSVAFSPGSARLVFTLSETLVGSAHASARALGRAEGQPGTFVYDTRGSGPAVKTFPGAASAAAFGPSPVFPTVAYATLDDIAHVYQFYSGRDIPLTGAGETLDAVRFDAGGAFVLTAGNDNTVRVYNSDTGGPPVEVLAGHQDRVVDASFGAGDSYVASSSDDGTARLWQGPEPTPSRQRPDAPLGDGGTTSIGFTFGGGRIVQASGGNTYSGLGRVLSAGDLRTLASFAAPPGRVFLGAQPSRDGGRVITVTAAVVNKRFVAAAVETFNARTGAAMARIVPGGGHALFTAVPDNGGDRVATVESGGRVELWDASSGRLLHQLDGAATPATTAAFSRDGSLLAVAHYPALPRHVGYLTKFAPIFAQLWDTRTGRLVRTISGDPLTPQIPGEALYSPLAVTFSPSGGLLALSGADSTVQIFDPRTGAERQRLPIAGHSVGAYAGTLAFSPDGRLLAGGSSAGAYVWRVPSFDLLPDFRNAEPGAAPPVGGAFQVRVAFTSNSRDLLMAGDNTLTAWSVTDDLQLFRAYPVAVGNLDAGATRLVTASGTGVSEYPCQLCGGLPTLLGLAGHRTTRGFTPRERFQYLSQG